MAARINILPSTPPESPTEKPRDPADLLKAKSHFVFDLDADTLHDGRAARSRAAFAVHQKISILYGIPTDALAAAHETLLRSSKRATTAADGAADRAQQQQSDEQRTKQRFAALLARFGKPASAHLLDGYLTVYRARLERALQPRAGAEALLARLRAQGKSVVVVTAGPREAGEWTVEKLGLSGFVGSVVAKGGFGEGAHGDLLARLGVDAGEVVYVAGGGGGEEGVVVAAKRAGMMAVLCTEERDDSYGEDGCFRICSLEQLADMMR
ncbi:hypothetical protein LTR50_002236 [Elasticomyces elasticus]|nr:hypothetical protein LTR50_002236 [Elasticomyces elasticus]